MKTKGKYIPFAKHAEAHLHDKDGYENSAGHLHFTWSFNTSLA